MRRRQGYAKSKAMPTSDQTPATPPLPSSTEAKQPLSEAAVRALAEAAARRGDGTPAKREGMTSEAAHEVGGRGGLDPTRYGDWEVNGIASDF